MNTSTSSCLGGRTSSKVSDRASVDRIHPRRSAAGRRDRCRARAGRPTFKASFGDITLDFSPALEKAKEEAAGDAMTTTMESTSPAPTPPTDAMKKYLEMTQGGSQPQAPVEEAPAQGGGFGGFELPKFSMPKVEVPKIELPEMPSMPEMTSAPEAVVEEVVPEPAAREPEVPQPPAPEPAAPEPTAPEPATPEPAAPEPTAIVPEPAAVAPEPAMAPEEGPTLAQQRYLEMTGGKAPEAQADAADGPSFTLPSLDEVELPKIELPKFEIPDFASKIQELKTSAQGAVDGVEVPKIEVPEFEVPEALRDLVGGAADAVSSAKTSALDSLHSLPLPEPVANALDQALGQDSALYGNFAKVGLPLLAYAWWSGTYGGFAGFATATRAFQDVSKEGSDAVLIDLRSDDEREAGGVPELKFGARTKVAAIPVQGTVRLPEGGTVARVASGATKLQVELTSLVVSNLEMVNPRKTRVYLMAGNGRTANGAARDLARRLRKKGCR